MPVLQYMRPEEWERQGEVRKQERKLDLARRQQEQQQAAEARKQRQGGAAKVGGRQSAKQHSHAGAAASVCCETEEGGRVYELLWCSPPLAGQLWGQGRK
jgi:hypothetical protein